MESVDRAGMRTVALTTTHPVGGLEADLVERDLLAVSVQVSEDGLVVSAECPS